MYHLLSLPFHCLNLRFLTASLSSLNHNSLDNGGLMYGLWSSALTNNTYKTVTLFLHTGKKPLRKWKFVHVSLHKLIHVGYDFTTCAIVHRGKEISEIYLQIISHVMYLKIITSVKLNCSSVTSIPLKKFQ